MENERTPTGHKKLPDVITIDGTTYRRVDDDRAVDLLNRVYTIAQTTGCTLAQAAWAINRSAGYTEIPFPPD